MGSLLIHSDLIQLQLDKLHPPLPIQIAQKEMITAAPSEYVENTYVGGVKRINLIKVKDKPNHMHVTINLTEEAAALPQIPW